MAKLVSPRIVEAEKLPETGKVPTTYRASTVENPEEIRQSIEISIKALNREVEQTIPRGSGTPTKPAKTKRLEHRHVQDARILRRDG